MSDLLTTPRPNQLSRTLSKLQGLPDGLRPWLMSFLLGNVVPFVGTASLRFDEVTSKRVVVRIRNRCASSSLPARSSSARRSSSSFSMDSIALSTRASVTP